jgi:hypothetical protein
VKTNWKLKGWDVAQVVECLPNQVQGNEFNPQYCQERRKEGRKKIIKMKDNKSVRSWEKEPLYIGGSIN